MEALRQDKNEMVPMHDLELGELSGIFVSIQLNADQKISIRRAFNRLRYLEEQERKKHDSTTNEGTTDGEK